MVRYNHFFNEMHFPYSDTFKKLFHRKNNDTKLQFFNTLKFLRLFDKGKQSNNDTYRVTSCSWPCSSGSF